ncbi:MAG: serine/threonine-protein kinase M1 [Thelocarpon impressellum]|nr:MAG: serine/threonine-protein kinase M1 [Thelocarpon impressellum]
MARGGGAPKPAQNNDHRSSREPGERGPPQSTLAAQIVSNLSTTNGETRPDDRGNFEQLLSEILGAGSGSPNDDGAVETDLDVNCKLVSVVTRAGLEVLLREDPFSMAESLLPQAVNSISVIQLTIKRMPQVLFTVPNDSPRTAEKPGAPLYIWLLPKLQQLLGYTTAEGIQESLLELLSTVLHPKKESPGLHHRRALPAFLRADMDQDHLAQNRRVALNFLRELAEKNELGFQETCVLAWAQVARVCSDNELNIVLLRLVEYLGHPNAMVHGVAFLELSNLSKVLNTSPRCLLTPFWRNIAVTVVRDLQTRPQTTQLLCDLLLMSVPDFLVLTQTHTLPYLVMCKKQDVMSKIVQARGGTTTVGSICFETVNLASILALLLLQGWSDTEKAVMELLRHASADFGTVNLPDLVRIEPILIAFELLKAAGDENDGKKAQVYEAIHVLATLATPKAGQLKASSRKSALIGPFFEAHVLGIMAQFSDVVNDIRVQQPYLEKKRCLRGVEEMIKLGKGHTSNALPQICACLQSALAIDTLRVQAFSTWSTMMTSLDGDDIEGMIEGTFAIVVEYWELLPSATHQQASGMIGHLVKKHMGLIKANINCMPSLSSIPLLSKLDTEIRKHKAQLDTRHRYLSFSSRCQHENVTVVKRALVELVHYLRQNQSFLHVSVVSEQPDPVVSELVRSILDACIKFTGGQPDIARLCAECIGLIGCLDPNRVEAVRENRDIVVVSNFEQADETIDWVMFFMQEVIVRAFMSATNTKAQGFLAFAMQELLKFCGFDASVTFRTRDMHTNATYRRWIALPEAVRNTLTPFLTSKYVVAVIVTKPEWPIFNSKLGHGAWLRTLVFDLLQKGTGENPTMLFPVCSRVIRGQDISISNFLLPFVALNVIIGGTEAQVMEKENLKLCSESVFQVLDYLSRWILEEKKEMSTSRSAARQGARSHAEDTKPQESAKIRRVELVLGMIPAEVISRRAVDCRSFARALFHWEQYIRQNRGSLEAPTAQPEMEPLYERLQDIYTQIDEPDGIEGISAHLHVLHIDQQILEHRKAGRWAAARSWYELQLAEQPENVDLQVSLLTCLRESGQHDVLLNQVDGMPQTPATVSKVLPFAVEASWVTGQWTKLEKYLGDGQATESADFNVTIGRALLSLRREDTAEFTRTVHTLQADIAKILSRSSTSSLQACHHDLLKFHVLAEMELLSGEGQESSQVKISSIMDTLDQRLEVLGAFLSDKQYLLGVRRAVMQVSKLPFGSEHVASLWLTSARLARKGNLTQQSFNAVLHASKLGAESATIEHSRLLWKEGQHRKAIRSLEGAIAVNAFRSYNYAARDDAATSLAGEQNEQQNLLTARAHLLLAKWLDSAGQTQSQGIIHRYQVAARAHLRWEKGHYYLGRHYNKLFESEKARPHNKQAQPFITGETAKLVIQSYLRSLTFGAKYIFQTLPRMLTLWLDLGFEVHSPVDSKYGTGKGFQDALFDARRAQLDQVHVSLKKYMEVLPAYMFYTALAQIVARICHPNKEVLGILQDIIVKVVSTHPQQALWTLLAVVKSSAKDRAARGAACLSRIKGDTRRTKASAAGLELKTMVMQGQKLSAQLLDVCDGEIQGKPSSVSLSRDLGFSHKTAPCPLVVPLEATLTASLPTIPDTIKSHKSFAGDAVTILSFLDDVLVLNSLQRPRKISVRGSDGKVYGLLCKPKDDLRKDQRLMEFNAMINRSLKRDAESSKRRLYIKTYAVTPLNEECGLIEWVDNLKTLRDILLKLYKAKGVYPNYPEIRNLLDEADSHASKTPIFTKRILPCFPPVFHEWFVEMFPEPGAWFTARLKYTRSCAVMSMVGMVLGLGDRHGENILFEEGNGGTFHVDFNCLFDKGLTFEKPEMVPFRLTHNMVDAFGVYGYEGPFRKSCELTLQILRQNEDTLMTILETFVYDPTTDFIGKKKRTTANVPDTPQEVLDSVRGKVRGLLKGESVPLSVEGHVHELIQQAVSPRYLAAMYIGWCAFF